MKGKTADDGNVIEAAIAPWGMKGGFCRAFSDRHANDRSLRLGGGREKVSRPDHIGRHMKIYVFKWGSRAVDNGEIEWVLDYR
jgi:hypothetical protein